MNATPPDGAFRIEELLADVIARLIGDARHVAVGMASPIPAMGALLARQRAGGRPLVSVLQGQTAFTDGGRELFDCAGQGRVDVFFLSGAQIDGEANINLVCTGDYHHPQTRFAGSFGSSYLAFVVPRVILFRLEHTPRTLVERVDFISAPGTSPPGIYRPGGPVALITSRCLFAFDRPRRRFRLESLHPGHALEEIVAHTGFSFDVPDIVPTTTPPCVETLRLLREVVAPEIAEVYPQFAASVFGPAVNRENARA
jgi:glutaconate CoA-transferase, subunit B